MAFHHKSKLRVFKELKHGVGFEEYLNLLRDPLLDCFLKFRSGTHRVFEELGRYAKRG